MGSEFLEVVFFHNLNTKDIYSREEDEDPYITICRPPMDVSKALENILGISHFSLLYLLTRHHDRTEEQAV